MTGQFYFASLLFLALAFETPNAFAVTLKGLTPADQKQVLQRFPELNNARPPLAKVDEAIRFLTQLETYSKVRYESTSDSEFLLTAIQLQRIGEIVISGNATYDRDEILAVMNMKSSAKFDSSRASEAQERVKEFYARRGYFNSIVSFDFQDKQGNVIDLHIRIREREPCLIQTIVFESQQVNPNLNSRLQREVKKYIETNFTEQNIAAIDGAIRGFLDENRYINTVAQQKEARYNSQKTQVTLVYELTDPYSYAVLMTGQTHFTSGHLLRNIKLDELTKGVDPAQDVANMIRQYYIASGFTHVQVAFDEQAVESEFLRKIFIDIKEGHRVRIANLEIAGRISRPSEYYSDFLFENSSGLIDDRYYVRADLDAGIKNLIVHLNNQGFLRAKAQSVRVDFDKEQKSANVTVVLDEGPLTQLSKISFEGVRAFDPATLLKQIQIAPNSPLRLNDLEASIEALKGFYFSRGYIEMKILNEDETLVGYNQNGLQAELRFRIFEGPQVFVRSVVVEGNQFTKDYVILREANVDIGDLLTPELLEETQKRLDKMAIFSRVELRTLEANTSASQRTLVIAVTERNPGLFKFGAGLTNKRELTARGFAGLSYNNIGGTARAVSIRGTLENNLVYDEYLEYELSVGYLEPFLFDKRLRGRAGYTRSEKIVEFPDEKIHATDSLTLAVERDLTSKIKLTWLVWGFDSVEQFDIEPVYVRENRQEIAYFGPSLDFDFRDNPFLPTRGVYFKWDADYSSPEIGSSDKIQFVRTQGHFSHYLQIGSPRVVWANSFGAGYEKNLSNEEDSGIPISFAYFLGGYTTVRGYSGSAGDRIPNDTEFPQSGSTQLIISGESSYYLIKSELRFPLSGPIGAVVFYDAGQVDIQGHDFEEPLRQSYGIGFRYNTPVGPISLDYGRKVSPQPGESPDQWHLSIGTF